MTSPAIKVFEDLASLSKAAAEMVVDTAVQSVAALGSFHMALSGGSTPRGLYRLLANEPLCSSPAWNRSHLFWSDERCVAPDDPGSNYGMARTLLLEEVSIPAENVHRIKGEIGSEAAALDYIDQLRSMQSDGLAWPRFDLVLLGMGSDGHTASLFPGPVTEQERLQPAMAVTADYEGRPADRVTLTPLSLNTARHLLFLIAGQDKARAVAAALQEPVDPVRWPVHRLRPESGRMTYLLDKPAAAKITVT